MSKQTAVDMTITTNEQLALYLAYHAYTTDNTINYLEIAEKNLDFLSSKITTLQNQTESKAIPELSDEEIIKWAYGKQYDPNDETQSSFVEGMKAYRELIKSKQCSATTR